MGFFGGSFGTGLATGLATSIDTSLRDAMEKRDEEMTRVKSFRWNAKHRNKTRLKKKINVLKMPLTNLYKSRRG